MDDHTQSHLHAVRQLAERGLTRGGCVVEDADGDWRLTVSAGPNVLREGPGTMSLLAQLTEVVFEPHDVHEHLDRTEKHVRALLRTTGEFSETIVALDRWLMENGWRVERGRLVAHEHDA